MAKAPPGKKKGSPPAPPDQKAEIAQLAGLISEARDCDVILLNYSMEPGIHYLVQQFLTKRARKKTNLLLIYTTEGGDPDCTYRIGRCLQSLYADITIVVAGWCKSAGTLLCIAANQLLVADSGELGPLDIQIAKADELGERSSGLTVEAAFEKLQQQSFELFIRNLGDIKAKVGGRITFRTAAEIASQMVVGVTSQIFAKFDPVSIGEDHRSNRVAEEYALRLNLKPKNLRTDARNDGLDMLLRGYPSHGFVIDREEATRLFRKVSAPTGQIAELLDLLGHDVVFPRNRNGDTLRLEFLNAEKPARPPRKAATRRRGPRTQPAAEGRNTPDVRRNIPSRSKQEPDQKEAA